MAVSAHDKVIAELNKLKKTELIDFIINKKLPVSISNSVLKEFSENYYENSSSIEKKEEILQEALSDTTECTNMACVRTSFGYQSKVSELQSINKLVMQMEKRLQDQEDIIALLKCKTSRNNLNSIQTETPNATSSSSNFNLVTDNNNKKNGQSTATARPASTEKTLTSAVNELLKGKQQTQHRPWQKTFKHKNSTNQNNPIFSQSQVQNAIKNAQTNVLNKYVGKKPVIGNNSSSSIKTVPKKGYLHVYRINADTQENDLTAHLKRVASHIDFKCIKLQKQNTLSSSFRVEFPISCCKEVYNPNLWPQGAAVKRFIFPKGNFQTTQNEN